MTDRTNDTSATFGFRNVAEEARQGLVNSVFTRVADRYDLMNDLMSGGLHRLWKNDVINWMAPPRGDTRHRLLDVAGGTADIALRYAQASGSGSAAVVCDISAEMMAAGVARLNARPEREKITFVQGNAEALPFPDGHFDAFTISFGIRNVTHLDAALGEAYRVLRPGGRFLCLEFSEVRLPLLDRLYDAFSFRAIPAIGELATGDREAYEYLVESIRRFPSQDVFATMIAEAGFARTRYRNLTGGIAAIHSGWRI